MSNVSYKTSVTETSLTLADLGDGLDTGHIRWESGAMFMLVRANAAITDGLACVIDLAETLIDTDISVKPVDVAAGGVVGFNNTGSTIADLTYFWLFAFGNGYGNAMTSHSIVRGDPLTVAATDGTLDEIALAAAGARIGIARAAGGDDLANFNIFFQGALGSMIQIVPAVTTAVNGENYGADIT